MADALDPERPVEPSRTATPAEAALPGASQEGDSDDRRRGVHLVIVNKASGVGHASYACKWLRNVPPGALRRIEVEDVDWPPRLRLCHSCFRPTPDGQPVTAGGAVSMARSASGLDAAAEVVDLGLQGTAYPSSA